MPATQGELPVPALDSAALDQLFLKARTHSVWLDRPVDDATLRRLYDLLRMAPTGGNATPMRLVFVKSAEGKARLKPTLNPLNVDKTMSAPVTAIVAYDVAFLEQMSKLFPSRDVKTSLLALPEEVRTQMAQQNANLQGAYLILAARALGLDCGPMAGFDRAKVDAELLADTTWKSLLLVNLGYGDADKVHPRNPRLDFDEAARIT
jgi:3-hydroxypropanoate dehydrogenase